MARRRLGEVLLERKVISATQLEEALALQRHTKQRLGAILVSRGFLTERALIQALASATGLEVVELDQIAPEWNAIHALRASFCEEQLLFPYAIETSRTRKQLLVAVSDPLNIPALEQVQRLTGMPPLPKLASMGAIQRAIERYYHKRGQRSGEHQAPPGLEADAEAAELVEDDPALEPNDLSLDRSRFGSLAPTPVKRDLDFLMTLDAPAKPSAERELRALIRLLTKKGLITRAELDAELAFEPVEPPKKR